MSQQGLSAGWSCWDADIVAQTKPNGFSTRGAKGVTLSLRSKAKAPARQPLVEVLELKDQQLMSKAGGVEQVSQEERPICLTYLFSPDSQSFHGATHMEAGSSQLVLPVSHINLV